MTEEQRRFARFLVDEHRYGYLLGDLTSYRIGTTAHFVLLLHEALNEIDRLRKGLTLVYGDLVSFESAKDAQEFYEDILRENAMLRSQIGGDSVVQ